jgi:hypothetical protein
MSAPRMDAAVAVDAQNAPTATWKTAQDAVSHSAHTHHLLVGKGRRNKNGHRFTHKIPDSPKGRPDHFSLSFLRVVALPADIFSPSSPRRFYVRIYVFLSHRYGNS